MAYRRLVLLPFAVAAVAAASACSAASDQGPGATQPSSTASQSRPAVASATAADSTTALVVPAGESGGALSVPRTLTVPSGWTARVWARVPDARMEAWTPEGELLVSQPSDGSVVELRPDAAGTASMTTLLSGLTNPQGLAFATVGGRTVLYVAESDQVDRYPWGSGGLDTPWV